MSTHHGVVLCCPRPVPVMMLILLTVIATVLHEAPQVVGSPTLFCANPGFRHWNKSVGESPYYVGQPSNFGTEKGQAAFSIGVPFEFGQSFAFGTRSIPTLKELSVDKRYVFKNIPHNCKVSFKDLVANGARPFHFSSGEICPDAAEQNIEIRMYEVREAGGRVLKGWLHVEVELKPKRSGYTNDKIDAIYVQFRDENFNAIGEFVTDPEEQCPQVTPGMTLPSKYQYIPCTAVGLREHKVSGAIYMVAYDRLFEKAKFEKYLSTEDKNIGKGIRFTWRYSEYSCNKHKRIRPEAYILTKKNIEVFLPSKGYKYLHRMLRKAPNYWLTAEWFGAADIKNPDKQLDCSHQIYDDNDMKGELREPKTEWITGTHPYKWEEDTYHEDYVIATGKEDGVLKKLYGYKSCRVKNEPYSKPPAFGGRCLTLNEFGAEFNALHECKTMNLNDEDLATTTKYTEYKDTLTENRKNQCGSPCDVPTEADLPKLLSFPKYAEGSRPGRVNTAKLNWSSASARAQRYARGRRYHGIMMMLGTMFTSLSIFVARYYKETFMSCECPSGHLWYTFHIGCTFAAFSVYGSALTALWETLLQWGHSTEMWGQFHASLGWFSLTLFFILLITGGFRLGLGEASRAARLAVMTLHSVFGFLNHILNLVLVMSSTFIHGSPSVTWCDENGAPGGVSPILLLAMLSMAIDVVFHVVMTVIQFLGDKAVGVKRAGFMCPIIPILPSTSHSDMKGSGIRKLLLLAFIALQGILTFAGFGIIATNEEPDNCKRGNTTCDTTVYMYGCSKLSKRFADMIQLSAQ